MAISIGDLMASLGMDTSKFDAGLAGAQEKINGVGEALTKGLTVPLAAVGAALAASAIGVGKWADDILDLRDQTGLSLQTLQEFRHVALVAGVDADTLANAAIKLTTAMSGSADESKNVVGALDKLGLAARNSAGNLIPMDDLLPQIITKLQGMDDTTTRNAIAGDIFGRSWAELAPILSMGSDEMLKAVDSAYALEGVLTDEAIEAADDFRVKWEELKESMMGMVRLVGLAVIPAMTEIFAIIQQYVVPALMSLFMWFESLSPTTKKVILIVAALAAALGPLLLAIGAVLAAIPIMAAGFAALTGPIGLAVVAIGAVVAAGALLMRNWESIKTAVKQLRDRVTEMVDRMMAGVVGTFLRGAQEVIDAVRYMKDTVVGLFLMMSDIIVGHSIVPDMVGDVLGEFDRMGHGATRSVDDLASALKGKFGAIRGMSQNLFGGGGFGTAPSDVARPLDFSAGAWAAANVRQAAPAAQWTAGGGGSARDSQQLAAMNGTLAAIESNTRNLGTKLNQYMGKSYLRELAATGSAVI